MQRAFDLKRALRRLKPEKRGALLRRPDRELTFVTHERPIDVPLLLDTCVYIHVLRGKTPSTVDRLLHTRSLYHSAVAVAELTFRLGARIPSNARELSARQHLEGVIRDIPAHRLFAPTSANWGDAGVLSGIRARIGGAPDTARGANDSLIFMQALTLGATVLTANVADFDVLQQIVPEGRVAFYRSV